MISRGQILNNIKILGPEATDFKKGNLSDKKWTYEIPR